MRISTEIGYLSSRIVWPDGKCCVVEGTLEVSMLWFQESEEGGFVLCDLGVWLLLHLFI